MTTGGREGINNARRRAQELGYPDVRSAVKAMFGDGLRCQEIARRLGIHSRAVQYHKMALDALGEQADNGFAAETYQAVIDGMADSRTPEEIAERTGVRLWKVQRYIQKINANGVFDGLQCETCPLSTPCKLAVLRRRRAACEHKIYVQPEERRAAASSEFEMWAEQVYRVGRTQGAQWGRHE